MSLSKYTIDTDRKTNALLKLIRAARAFVVEDLRAANAESFPNRAVMEEALLDAAFEAVAEIGNYGPLWMELRRLLGVEGGGTQYQHGKMVERLKELLQQEKVVEAIQRDANIALEQRREAVAKLNAYQYERAQESLRASPAIEKRVAHADWYRAGGGSICICGLPYYDHESPRGYGWLRILCNGHLVKV